MERDARASKLIIFVIVFIDLLGFGIMIPMLPFFAKSMGATALQMSFLMFVYSFMQMLVAPFWGQLSDRMGRRPVLLVTILGQGLAFLWGGLSTSFVSLLLSRVLAGIFAANISTASAYMADITKPEERAKGMGLIGAAFGLGFIFGPGIGGVLMKYGVHWPPLAAAAICFLNFLLATKILMEPLRETGDREKNRRRFSWKDLSRVISDKKLLIPILSYFLITMAFVQLEITFGYFVMDRFSFDAQDAGFLLVFLGVVMALVQGGVLGPLNKRFKEVALVFWGALLAIGGLSFVVVSMSLPSLMVGLMLIAGGYSLMNPCLSSLVSKSAPLGAQGATLGIFQSSSSLARVLAPILAGALYDYRLTLPLLVSVGFLAIMWMIWMFSSTRFPSHSPDI